jgi:hypothetical protein
MRVNQLEMKISILAVVAYLAPAFAAPLDFVLSEDKGVKSDEGNLSSSSNSLGVDLGYARYEGFYNTATGVNEVCRNTSFQYLMLLDSLNSVI